MGIEEFIYERDRFEAALSEYGEGRRRAEEEAYVQEHRLNAGLAAELDNTEYKYNLRKKNLDDLVEVKLSSLKGALSDARAREAAISEKGYLKYKRKYNAERSASGALSAVGGSEADVADKLCDVVSSIKEISGSSVPSAFVGICQFFNKNYRKDRYKSILENTEQLEAIVAQTEQTLMEARAFLLREIEEDTARRLAEITQRQNEGMLRIKQEKEEEEKNAALRLLDSLEKDILTLDACKHAQRRVQGYGDFCRGACAGGIGEITLGYAKCGASDADSTLKAILSGIFGSAYDAGCVKVPFVLGKAAQKPLLIKYSPRESDEMYALLANYAAQYLFCFADAGVKVNICGAGEPFAALAGDSRVNIVSDSSAVSRLISSLAEGAFDRDTVQALFISDVSMVRGSLARQALSDILKRAADCGVHVFMGAQTYDALAESETCLCDIAELCGSVLNMEAGGALCLPEPIDSSVIARICAADAVCGVRFDSAAFFENDGFLLGTAGAEHLTVPREGDVDFIVYGGGAEAKMSVFLAFLSKLIAVYGCALTVNVLISGALQSRLAECGVDFSALSAAGVNITPSLTTFLSRINGKKGDFAYNVVFDPASYHTDASSLHMERMLCMGRALNLFIAGSAGNVRAKCGYIGKACAHVIELSAEDEPMRAEYCGKACTRTAFTLYGAEELWQNTYLSILTPGSSPCPWVDKYKELSM